MADPENAKASGDRGNTKSAASEDSEKDVAEHVLAQLKILSDKPDVADIRTSETTKEGLLGRLRDLGPTTQDVSSSAEANPQSAIPAQLNALSTLSELQHTRPVGQIRRHVPPVQDAPTQTPNAETSDHSSSVAEPLDRHMVASVQLMLHHTDRLRLAQPPQQISDTRSGRASKADAAVAPPPGPRPTATLFPEQDRHDALDCPPLGSVAPHTRSAQLSARQALLPAPQSPPPVQAHLQSEQLTEVQSQHSTLSEPPSQYQSLDHAQGVQGTANPAQFLISASLPASEEQDTLPAMFERDQEAVQTGFASSGNTVTSSFASSATASQSQQHGVKGHAPLPHTTGISPSRMRRAGLVSGGLVAASVIAVFVLTISPSEHDGSLEPDLALLSPGKVFQSPKMESAAPSAQPSTQSPAQSPAQPKAATKRDEAPTRLAIVTPPAPVPATRPAASPASDSIGSNPAGSRASGSDTVASSGGSDVSAPQPSAPQPSSTTAPIVKQATLASDSTSFEIIQDKLRQGHAAMRKGAIRKAREIYKQALQAGSTHAALALGQAYDPNYLISRVADAKPDPEQAVYWYKKAEAAGVSSARTRIDRLLNS